jgi:hypothetical protein
MPTDLESRLEVSYDIRLDEPNQGKKKSILDTLHTKSEEQQAEEMVEYWKKQMEIVNISSHKEKTVQLGGFTLKATSSCKLEEPASKKEKEVLETLVMSPLDTKETLNPMQLTVRDCLEGENDARKWFVSTMHLYIKYLIDRDNLQKVIDEQHQKSFLGSLYDVYIGESSKKKETPKKAKERLNLIRQDCFNINSPDVWDEFTEDILKTGTVSIPLFEQVTDICLRNVNNS